MDQKQGFLYRHRTPLLLALMLTTMLACTLSSRQSLRQGAAAVSLPLLQAEESPDALTAFRRQREDTALQDMAALQALVDAPSLDDQTRHEAAQQLRALVDAREKQIALEGALLESGFSPCVAVVSPGSVTIVTTRETLTPAESALLLTMAQVHGGADPSGVRVIAGGPQEKND